MLTKESIEEKTFKKGLFGYNKDEVNSFIGEDGRYAGDDTILIINH